MLSTVRVQILVALDFHILQENASMVKFHMLKEDASNFKWLRMHGCGQHNTSERDN